MTFVGVSSIARSVPRDYCISYIVKFVTSEMGAIEWNSHVKLGEEERHLTSPQDEQFLSAVVAPRRQMGGPTVPVHVRISDIETITQSAGKQWL